MRPCADIRHEYAARRRFQSSLKILKEVKGDFWEKVPLTRFSALHKYGKLWGNNLWIKSEFFISIKRIKLEIWNMCADKSAEKKKQPSFQGGNDGKRRKN